MRVSDELFAVINDPALQRVVVNGKVKDKIADIDEAFGIDPDWENMDRHEIDVDVSSDTQAAIDHLTGLNNDQAPDLMDGDFHLVFFKDDGDEDTEPQVTLEYREVDHDPEIPPTILFG